MEKICTKCGQVLPATTEYFRTNKLGKFGLTAECRKCLILRDTEYRERNSEKRHAEMLAYRKAHPEWTKEVKRRHYQKHRDKVIARARRYREENPMYWKRPIEKEAEKSAKRHARKKNAPGNFTVQDVREKYQSQRGECFYCHCVLDGAYHVDHYIPLSKGGTNWPDNLVIACAKCNLTKGDRMPDDFVARFL